MSSGTAATLSSPTPGAARSRLGRVRPAPAASGAAPAVATGGRTATVAAVGENTRECLGSAVSVPAIASGTTSTASSIARRNAPSRKGASEPSTLRVPSGKTTTEAPSWSRLAHLLEGGTRAVLVSPRERDVPGGPHEPTQKRDPEDRHLGEKLHLPGQQAEQEDVRHRAVVRHEEVRAARIRRARDLHVEVPKGIDGDGQRAGASEHAAHTCPVAVLAECGEPVDGYDRHPGDDDRDVAGPDQIRQRHGDDSPLEESPGRPRQSPNPKSKI